MKEKLKKIIDELSALKENAEQNSRYLVKDGREVDDISRARSEGYASAYSFCIMRLRKLYFTIK